MMRAALCLLLVAGSAMAQNASDAKPQEKQDKPAERPRLNLKLDNPSSFARVAPPEKEQPKGLPTLGADAKPAEQSSRPISESPGFPKDSNPGH
jgi:hypothetical protein